MKFLRRAARVLMPRSTLALPGASQHDFYADDKKALGGAADPSLRLAGLDDVRERVRERHVLDLGCAEGLALQYLMAGEPRSAHGVDNSPRRIDSARRLNTDPRLRFDVVELNIAQNLDSAPFASGYDVVMCLGLYQHLLPRWRDEVMQRALGRCGEIFVFRCCKREEQNGRNVIERSGFRLLRSIAHEGIAPLLVYGRDNS